MAATADQRSGNGLRTLVVACVALEALVMVGLAVFLVVDAIGASQQDRVADLGLAVCALVVGVGLGWCARGVAQAQRWTRGPVFTWQLVQAGVAMPVSTSERWWVGVPLLAVAVVVGVLMAGRYVVPQREVD